MTVRAFAPGRVNLIGEHTDHAGGLAVPMAVPLGTTVEGVPTDERVVRLRSAELEGDAVVPLASGSPGWLASFPPGWVRFAAAVVAEVRPPHGFTGDVRTTIPIGAGLSSSAAFAVALGLALGDRGEPIDRARRAQRAEQLATGVPCGLMDQLTSAAGVADHALLIDFATEAVTPVALPGDLQVVVVHSGQPRTLAGSAYGDRRRSCETAASIVGPLRDATIADLDRIVDPVVRQRARHVVTENARVRSFIDALARDDRATLGRLLDESHASLRDDFDVSTPALDALVERLRRRPGVHGCRLTGAGFGGCVVALTEPGALDEGWNVRPSAGASVEGGVD